LGLLIFWAAMVAGRLWLDQAPWPHGPWHTLVEICSGVLSFPFVALVMLLDPQYEAGLMMFIVAVVGNCYLWGYCIEWSIRGLGRP
jgi:hypothetical protein